MSIPNTSKTPRPEWVLGGDPESIERQEAQGQQALVKSQQLPADGLTPELAAAHGIEIVGPSADDPLFVDVRLPENLKKRGTDHSMWSEIVDANGAKVASIFYKAAFYDRCAFIRFDEPEAR